MSTVAEFARSLHEQESLSNTRTLVSAQCPQHQHVLYDVKAVICDVYGTLVNYWKPGFDEEAGKMGTLLSAFKKTIDFFGMERVLRTMNPAQSPEETLRDFYHGLIVLNHEKSLSKGIEFPEVRIEEVWQIIISMLARHGFSPSIKNIDNPKDLSRCIAFYYNFCALGRGFYPGVVDSLLALQNRHIKAGIVSNAQFYTPVDLTLFARDQNRNIEDYLEVFDLDIIFYSFEYGMAKPNAILFRKLYDALYELKILPNQTVFIGNDLSSDIKPALEAGMRTAFFTGDNKTAFFHDQKDTVVPDIAFSHWDELPKRLVFNEK